MMYYSSQWLKDVRKTNRLTQREMASMFGVHRGTYANWEILYKDKKLPKHVIKKFTNVNMQLTYKSCIIMKSNIKETLFRRIWKWIMRKN